MGERILGTLDNGGRVHGSLVSFSSSFVNGGDGTPVMDVRSISQTRIYYLIPAHKHPTLGRVEYNCAWYWTQAPAP